MKRVIFVLVIVCYSSIEFVYSQNTLQNFALEFQGLKAREAKREIAYASIQGDPYYSNDFVKSTVFLINGDSSIVPLRYDLYMDEMEFKQNDKTLWLNKKEVASIMYGSEKLISCDMKEKDKFLYFFVITNGDYSLLRRQNVNLLSAEKLKGFSDAKPIRFESMPIEYFVKINDLLPTIILTTKDLKKLVADNAPAREFLKKEKIKPGKKDDLVKLVEFLNAQ